MTKAKDGALEAMATRIRDRALERGGELLKQVKAAKGGRPSKTRAPQDPSLRTRNGAAKDAGLSPAQAKLMLRVASVTLNEDAP